MNALQRIKVIYIAGAGRSGSTLLARMLGQLPEVVSVGELRHFLAKGYLAGPDNVRCGCGEFFSACPLWREVRGHLGRAGWDLQSMDIAALTRSVDRIRYVARLMSPVRSRALNERYRLFMRFLIELYQAIAAAGGGSIVLDASKDLSLLYLLAFESAIELSVVHLVRDSRGVAYSWTRQRRKLEFVEHEEYLPQYSPAYSAIDWTVRNLAVEASRFWADRYVRVRYEDLISDPRAAVRTLGRRLDADGKVDFIGDQSVTFSRRCHISAGNPNRFERGEIELRLDTAWKEAMPKGSRRLVSLLTAPLRWRYLYH